MGKKSGKVHKGGFIHRSSMAHNKRSYGMGNELAACGVRKLDGYSVHPARKLTSCPDCMRITKKSMEASAQAGADGKMPKRVTEVLGSGAAS
jgi:hypothetical protein